jgi:phosphonoacetate hydrolase
MRQGLFVLVFFCSFLLVSSEARKPVPIPKAKAPRQQIIIIMFDGLGEEYYRSTKMPALNFIEAHGIYKVVPSLMPSVTNVNNTSICTGELPSKHGITGNAFYNAAKNEEELMEEGSLVLTSTIFERAGRSGIRSALFSSKKKTISLLLKGTALSVSPETASEEWIKKIGTPPSIYSREVKLLVDGGHTLFNAA